MGRTVQIVIIAFVIMLVAGIAILYITRSRLEADRVRCEDHLREIGLVGVRHASIPGQGLPTTPKSELPPGTFLNPELTPDRRMSWYVYLLGAVNDTNINSSAKKQMPGGLDEILKSYAATEAWDAPANQKLNEYRMKTAICPAQYREGIPVLSNYIASGGLGLDTPGLPFEQSSKKAGAYRYDGPTPDKAFIDGMHQTAQFLETTENLVPWLQGGAGTLRGLDPAASPYLGAGRPFGGCHPGGMYASMADGSVRFVKDSIDPALFQAMLTRAGGVDEVPMDSP